MFLAIGLAAAASKAGQVMLSFSFIVIVHELGHYAAARLCKCRVEQVYLFFHPWFSLWKKKIGDTEFGIGWIPLGGSIAISGRLDDAGEDGQPTPALPHEYRGKTARQRLAISLAGIVMNLVTGTALLLVMNLFLGHQHMDIYVDEFLRAKAGRYLQTSAASMFSAGNLFLAHWNWAKWTVLTGLLSISIGIFNLLPIPGTDGGNAFTILIEMATGWKPTLNLELASTGVSMLFLLVLTIHDVWLDAARLLA